MENYQNIHRGWRVIGGRRIFFRSKWEYNYALYLQWLKTDNYIVDWQHEPKTFWFEGIKRGCVSYKPDFYVMCHVPEANYWVEVKGFWDKKSHTKVKRFSKYFPEEKLIIADANWFRQNGKKLKLIIDKWE